MIRFAVLSFLISVVIFSSNTSSFSQNRTTDVNTPVIWETFGIRELKNEIDKKDKEIAELKKRVEELSFENTRLKTTISERDYFNARKVEKIKYYVNICERRPRNKKFFFGWVKRTLKD